MTPVLKVGNPHVRHAGMCTHTNSPLSTHQCHAANLRFERLRSLRLRCPHLHHTVTRAAVAAQRGVALRALDCCTQPLVRLLVRLLRG